MKFRKCYLLVLFVFLGNILYAQPSLVLNEINLEESVSTVEEKIKAISEEVRIIKIEEPGLPVASKSETHILAKGVSTKNSVIEEVILTFADNQLVCIEASGKAGDVFVKTRSDEPRDFFGLDVYMADRLFYNKEKDNVKIMTEPAMHAMLFVWSNPFATGTKSKYEINEITIPSFLKMGESLGSIKPILEANSKFTAPKELNSSDSNATFQINCFGVNYLGFPRKVEARFGDDTLNSAWLLTSKGEEERIRKFLTLQFGKPNIVNEQWEVFDNYKVALRKDKPEILLLSDKLAAQYKNEGYFD